MTVTPDHVDENKRAAQQIGKTTYADFLGLFQQLDGVELPGE